MQDNIVLGAKYTAEVLSVILAIGFWGSLDEPLSVLAVIGTAILWFVTKNVLVSVAAIIFH